MKGRILIVDDDLEIIKVLKKRLEANQYEVISAVNGEEALLKTKNEKPDLVITDLMLPVISGYEVCCRLKHDPEVSHIPILVLTGRIKSTDQKLAQQCGVNGYIPKPFCSDMLLAEVHRLLCYPTAHL